MWNLDLKTKMNEIREIFWVWEPERAGRMKKESEEGMNSIEVLHMQVQKQDYETH
jgi:hypothetical protein